MYIVKRSVVILGDHKALPGGWRPCELLDASTISKLFKIKFCIRGRFISYRLADLQPQSFISNQQLHKTNANQPLDCINPAGAYQEPSEKASPQLLSGL